MTEMINESTDDQDRGKSAQIARLLSGELEATGINTDILLDAYLTLDEHPETPDYVEYDISEELEHGGMPDAETVIARLDFKDPAKYLRTARLLELMHVWYGEMLVEDIFGNRTEDTIIRIREALEMALREKQGSYLLELRARLLLNDLDSNETFDLSPDSVGALSQIELEKTFAGKDRSDIRDFEFLQQERMQAIIEKEFRIKLASLPLQEQFWFLQFIKNKEASEIGLVKEFVSRYGKSGLRTFLALDYGKELGGKIIEIGLHDPDDMAEEIFTTYAKILDASAGLAGRIEKGLVGSSLPQETQISATEAMCQTILRRAKDLLMSAYVIGVENKGGKYGVADLRNAMQGLETFLEIVGGLDDHTSGYNILLHKSGKEEHEQRFIVEDQKGQMYELVIMVRPEEDLVKRAQARINFELNFDTRKPNKNLKRAFGQETKFASDGSVKKESVLRIGIDLDTHDRANPAVSLDLGRNEWQSLKLERTGDVLGNLLKLSGSHHNPESFPRELARPEIFKELATAFQHYLENLPK